VQGTEKPDTLTPDAEYRVRLSRWRDRQARQERRAAFFRRAGRMAFGLVVLLALLSDKESTRNKLFLIGVPCLLLQAAVTARRRALERARRAGRAAAWYETRLACLAGEWAGRGPAGERFIDQEHSYAFDLDLFGRGSLFERMTLARTSAGEAALADWLKAPADADIVRARQAAVAELRDDVEGREHTALLPPEGVVDLAEFRQWAATGSAPGPAWARIAAFATVVAALGALTGGLVLGFGPWPLLIALAAEATVAYRLRERVQGTIAAVRGRSADLRLIARILARLEGGGFRSPWLSRRQVDLLTGARVPSRAVGRLAWLVSLLDVKQDFPHVWLVAPLLWTTHLAFCLASWRRRYRAEVLHWLGVLGSFEALHSLASYSYENPADPFPELVPGGPLLEAESLGHPLLPPGRCVPNDVTLGRDTALLVVSGSNMSGKSTLLRAVGINAVLAQAGAPVRARRLRLSPLAIGATVRVQDSLQAGKSRFFAELLRVRQVIEMARETRPLLFLLDELFAGTNSTDRRAGADAVARALVGAGAVGLLTTHDLELTSLGDRFEGRAQNAHFAERIAGDAVTFDYVMRPGVVPQGNALAILRAAGFAI
jgi:hypothetical protein